MKNNTNGPTVLKVAKYIRVSTDKQAKTGDSLREQDETLTEYIDKHSNMITYSTYIDDGISGQKLERGDFARLMDDIKTNKIDLIIFTKLDRWFRSLRHYLNTQEIIEKHNISWTAVSQPFFDTTTAHGRAFVAQSMTWAELEAQNDSERILSVFENKVKNGEVISGTAPLGYKIVDKHLVSNEDAEKVVKLFEFYNKEPNLRALMRFAADEFGIVRTHCTFRRLLQNTKYKGEFRDNKNYCIPLVSKELWEECNRLLGRNQRANKVRDYVFTGMLTCADCGRKLTASTVTKYSGGKKMETKIGPDGRMMFKYPAYRCPWRVNGHDCINSKQYYESTLERKMLNRIKEDIQKYIASYEVSVAPVVNNEAKIRSLENKIAKLKDLYLNELITLEEFKIDKANYEDAISALPTTNVKKKDLSHVKEILEMDIDEIYHTMTVKEKNFFWRKFINEIRIDNNHNIEVRFL